jgi:NADH-quinone oxidoreductase subunit N
MSYLELLRLVAPEALLVLAAFAVLSADLFALRDLEIKFRRIIGVLIGCFGCVAAIGWMIALPETATALDGMFILDPAGQFTKVALLVLTILTLLLSLNSDFTFHTGEYLALVLFAAVGMMFLVSSADVLMIFLSLELTSLSLYVLAAFNKADWRSSESALKYFLIGGMSAAFTLFGLSLLYGLSGSTSLPQIAAAIRGSGPDPVLILALVMTLAGFAFKVAAAPFHLWAPDVYQGAPLPSAAFIASGSKVAGFFVLARVVSLGFSGPDGTANWPGGLPVWVSLIGIIAAVSMVLGNLAALAQTSVRRLLAYSAVAHAGYMLLGVAAQGPSATASLVYYVITYALTTLGAFGVVDVVQKQTGGDRLVDFAGLSRRSPGVAICMMVFVLSLAGIPPLAGFFGKFFIFSEALKSGAAGLPLLWLVILALGLSAVSLFYYLQVLKQIFVVPAASETPVTVQTPLLQEVVLIVLAFAVVALGCLPQWMLQHLLPVAVVARL